MGVALIWLFNTVVELVVWAVIINPILSWLFAFNVINASNALVGTIARTLDAVTDPLLRPIRRFVPTLGGVDLSPLVLILALQFIKIVVNVQLAPLIRGF